MNLLGVSIEEAKEMTEKLAKSIMPLELKVLPEIAFQNTWNQNVLMYVEEMDTKESDSVQGFILCLFLHIQNKIVGHFSASCFQCSICLTFAPLLVVLTAWPGVWGFAVRQQLGARDSVEATCWWPRRPPGSACLRSTLTTTTFILDLWRSSTRRAEQDCELDQGAITFTWWTWWSGDPLQTKTPKETKVSKVLARQCSEVEGFMFGSQWVPY